MSIFRRHACLFRFSLPDLPYPYDALAPYMSRETLEFHHDNNLAKARSGKTSQSRRL
jgi:superoxide dismutase